MSFFDTLVENEYNFNIFIYPHSAQLPYIRCLNVDQYGIAFKTILPNIASPKYYLLNLA